LNFPVEHRRKVLDEYLGDDAEVYTLKALLTPNQQKTLTLKLAVLKPEWDQRECEQSGCVARFHNWFLAHKAEDFKSSAIHPVREHCGLGIPPDTFTTNASETINSVLKSKVDCQNSWTECGPWLMNSSKSLKGLFVSVGSTDLLHNINT